MFYKPSQNTNSVELLAPATRTGDATGSGVDITQYDGHIAVYLHSSDTDDNNLNVTVQHSDDDSSYSDFSSFTEIGTDNGGLYKLSLDTHAMKKYIRISATQDASGVTYSALMVGIKQYP